MSKVRCGTIVIGSINMGEDGKYIAHRVNGPGGEVQVGTADTQLGALNLIAQSLIAKSLDEGSLNPTQRERMRELLNQLDGIGLSELSRAIAAVLR